MTFINVGLVVHGTSSSRLLMVARDHRAILATASNPNHALAGDTIAIRKKGGAELGGRSLRPTGTRLVHMDWILKEPPEVKADADLAGLLNADVRLPPGRWIEEDPYIPIAELKPFKDELWQFKEGGTVRHEQMLTNVVTHVSPLIPGETYELMAGTSAIEEFSGDTDMTITITNHDYVTEEVPPWNRILEDFALLYDLIKTPKSASPQVHQTSNISLAGTGFNRPICPKAQIG